MSRSFRLKLGCLLGCNALILTAAILLLLYCASQNRIGYPYDTSIGLLAAVAMGQLSVVSCIFAMLEPCRPSRWILAFVLGLSVAGLSTLVDAVTDHRPWNSLEAFERYTEVFALALATTVAFFLAVRVTWWPVRNLTSFFGSNSAKIKERQHPTSSR